MVEAPVAAGLFPVAQRTNWTVLLS